MGVRNLSGGKIKVGAWRYLSLYSPAVSIEAGANGDPILEVRVRA